jgi:hypothetical protein
MSLLKEKVAATDRIINRKIREEFALKDATLLPMPTIAQNSEAILSEFW